MACSLLISGNKNPSFLVALGGGGFKLIEFFWEALLLGGQISEIQISSQNKFYALVVCSGPVYFNVVVEKLTQTTVSQESHKHSMRTGEGKMNYD